MFRKVFLVGIYASRNKQRRRPTVLEMNSSLLWTAGWLLGVGEEGVLVTPPTVEQPPHPTPVSRSNLQYGCFREHGLVWFACQSHLPAQRGTPRGR